LALAAIAPLSSVHATTQTTSFSKIISFDGVTVTVSGTITIDTTAKTLSATVTITAVNSTTGGVIFSKTITINLSSSMNGSLNFVLNIPSIPFMLAASCTITTTSTATCLVTRTPDLNHNGTVDIVDVSMIAVAFDSTLGSSRYNPSADLNGDGKVDIIDVAIAAADFGATVY
jgi:hypothetical protein